MSKKNQTKSNINKETQPVQDTDVQDTGAKKERVPFDKDQRKIDIVRVRKDAMSQIGLNLSTIIEAIENDGIEIEIENNEQWFIIWKKA